MGEGSSSKSSKENMMCILMVETFGLADTHDVWKEGSGISHDFRWCIYE